MNKAKTNSLTLPQEISHLISKISEKELDFFADDDSEVLHEFRVNIRKLRTWLQIFERAGYRVKKLQKHLVHCHLMGNELRNIDVLLPWMKKNPELVSPKSIQAVNRIQKRVKKVFIKDLLHDDPMRKLRVLGRDFLSQIREVNTHDFHPYVNRYIEERMQDVTHILPNAIDDLQQLHRIRKTLKKVRYSLDLMPVIDANKIDTLKELQDILGSINDRCVWIEVLHSKLQKIKEAAALETIFKKEIQDSLDAFRSYIKDTDIQIASENYNG